MTLEAATKQEWQKTKPPQGAKAPDQRIFIDKLNTTFS